MSALVEQKLSHELVTRSDVPARADYGEYRQELRHDFFHSCAYCTMTEFEAHAIRFVIDHYEPKNARPELEHAYSNLMYCCDECNSRKGDRCPPETARANDFRFFRPDEDLRSEHFDRSGAEVRHKTNVGYYTAEALDLNRPALRKLREIRQRLEHCAPLVSEGVMALRAFSIDQLPQGVRSQALKVIGRAEEAEGRLSQDMDNLLRNFARSTLIDPEQTPEEVQRLAERSEKLSALGGLYAGSWRAPRKGRSPDQGPAA